MGETVVGEMETVRENADLLESLVSGERWPYPTYIDLLFRV